MTTFNVGYFVGSLAKASINRTLARALVSLAPKELRLKEVPFGDLPLYSHDYDADLCSALCPRLSSGGRGRAPIPGLAECNPRPRRPRSIAPTVGHDTRWQVCLG